MSNKNDKSDNLFGKIPKNLNLIGILVIVINIVTIYFVARLLF